MSYRAHVKTRLGPITLEVSAEGVTRIHFGAKAPEAAKDAPALFRRAAREITEYFEGKRRRFTFPLDAEGTEFQKRVWNALREVPYGEVVTYGELARRAGNPSASRAVGGAMSKNPLPIVVPCHRVIASGRKIGGFTGGLSLKQRLLRLEGFSEAFGP